MFWPPLFMFELSILALLHLPLLLPFLTTLPYSIPSALSVQNVTPDTSSREETISFSSGSGSKWIKLEV